MCISIKFRVLVGVFPSENNLISFIYTWPNSKLREKKKEKSEDAHEEEDQAMQIKKSAALPSSLLLFYREMSFIELHSTIFFMIYSKERGKSVSSEKSPKLMKNLEWLNL